MFMQNKISLWLSARHPVSLPAVQPDSACLSIYIRGILILFLCLGRGSGWRWGQGYCECFSSRETEVRPTRLRLGKRPQNIRPQCHIQQPPRFWTFFLRVTAPCWCGLCSRRLRPRHGEMMKRRRKTQLDASATAAFVIEPVMTIWFRQAGQRDQENRVVSRGNSGRVGEARLCFWFIVGFLVQRARGLSSAPTLDTERMWKCKVRSSHRSHYDLEAQSGAKLAGQRPKNRICYLQGPSYSTQRSSSPETSSPDKQSSETKHHRGVWELPPKNLFNLNKSMCFYSHNQRTTGEAQLAERPKPRGNVNI